MSEKVVDPINLAAEDADLKNALLAAFGTDALEWFDESNEAVVQLATESNLLTTEVSAIGIAVDLEFAHDQLTLALQNGVGDAARACESADMNLRKGIENAVRYVIFEVGQQLFGIPIDGVREIERCGKVTVIPRTPEWLRGVTNLRGKIYSVTDLRKLLQLENERPSTAEKIIVVQSKRWETTTALVVDCVLGIRSLEANPEPAKCVAGPIAAFASGIATLQEVSIVLIQPDLLLGCNDLQSFSDS